MVMIVCFMLRIFYHNLKSLQEEREDPFDCPVRMAGAQAEAEDRAGGSGPEVISSEVECGSGDGTGLQICAPILGKQILPSQRPSHTLVSFFPQLLPWPGE